MNINISKIQLRRGIENAITLNLLDVGEVAFTTDTNRLFVGVDPSQSNAVSIVHNAQNPGGFPFNNVEILTEFSPTNQQIFDNAARNINTAFIVSAPMAVLSAPPMSGLVLTPLNVQQFSSSGGLVGQVPFTISTQGNHIGSAKISYHIVDSNTDTPLRTGQLTIFFQGNTFPASIVDEAVSNPYAGFPTGGMPIDPNIRYGNIQFVANTTGGAITLLYQIVNGSMPPPIPVMYFRVEQPNIVT